MRSIANLRPIQAMAASLFFKHRRLLVKGPRQYFGKTELGVRLAHNLTSEEGATTSMFVAKNALARKKATREKFMRIFDARDFAVNTELIYNKKHPTSQIFMGSIDKDPGSQRGGTLNFLHMSEMAFWNLEHGETVSDVWQKVLRHLLSQRDGYCYGESTTNGFNGFKDFWDNAKEFGFHTLSVSLSQMLELGLITQDTFDKEKREVHPLVFAQELECEWVTFQGLVYNELDEAVHVAEVPPPEEWQSIIAAIDWGWKPSATSVLFGYVKDEIVYVFDEIYEFEQRIEDTAAAIHEKLRYWGIERFVAVADHDLARNKELEVRGIGTVLADKVNVAGNRIEIKEHLWKGLIRIDPRCKALIRDLSHATWHPKKEGELDANCSWGHWDAEAAMRYLIRGLKTHEADEPDENPMKDADQASARAWEINRRAGRGDY